MLTDSAQTVDSSVVPVALIQAAQTAAEAAAKAGVFNAPASVTPKYPVLNAPRLYKIVVHGSNVTLLGSGASETIKLPITTP
jgi:hypothetical protein